MCVTDCTVPIFSYTPETTTIGSVSLLVVNRESESQIQDRRLIYECRCDERLKSRVEESTRLTYTQLVGELEHIKTETRLLNERFASVMGEC